MIYGYTRKTDIHKGHPDYERLMHGEHPVDAVMKTSNFKELMSKLDPTDTVVIINNAHLGKNRFEAEARAEMIEMCGAKLINLQKVREQERE